jgi:hypothetical protein
MTDTSATQNSQQLFLVLPRNLSLSSGGTLWSTFIAFNHCVASRKSAGEDLSYYIVGNYRNLYLGHFRDVTHVLNISSSDLVLDIPVKRPYNHWKGSLGGEMGNVMYKLQDGYPYEYTE